ncbi:hypothetical protein [Trichocoleus sp. AS-A1]|uniref:hypothetical protein n=1 Tax=Trichocoleus sp. AS-A1 TaxID=2933921 RepID=UPI001684A189
MGEQGACDRILNSGKPGNLACGAAFFYGTSTVFPPFTLLLRSQFKVFCERTSQPKWLKA